MIRCPLVYMSLVPRTLVGWFTDDLRGYWAWMSSDPHCKGQGLQMLI